jgi:hypothetical protein
MPTLIVGVGIFFLGPKNSVVLKGTDLSVP